MILEEEEKEVESAAVDKDVETAEGEAPRRPMIPVGAFRLPAIGLPPSSAPEPEEEEEEEKEQKEEEEQEEEEAIPVIEEPEEEEIVEPSIADPEESDEEVDGHVQDEEAEQGEEEEHKVVEQSLPPPLPSGRPSAPPPARPLVAAPPSPPSEIYDEPEPMEEQEQDEEDEEEVQPEEVEESAPAPPPRSYPTPTSSASLPPPSRPLPVVSDLVIPPRSTTLLSSSPTITQIPSPSTVTTKSVTFEQLMEYSSSLGAQILAAAYAKLNDKSTSKSSGAGGGVGGDVDFINYCYSRAQGALPPFLSPTTGEMEYGFLIQEFTAPTKSSSSSTPTTNSNNNNNAGNNDNAIGGGGGGGKDNMIKDEPRPGDIAILEFRIKHNLSTTSVGSSTAPRLAIVSNWDERKRKLKVIELDSKGGGGAHEGGYRVEDIKSGRARIWRVKPRQ